MNYNRTTWIPRALIGRTSRAARGTRAFYGKRCGGIEKQVLQSLWN